MIAGGGRLFGEALEEFLKSRKCDPTLKTSTKDYDDQRAKALLQSWPGLENLAIRRISKEDCEQWAAKFAEKYDGSTYNHTISMVKHAFEKAVDRGVRYDNPARSLKRQADLPKKTTLPCLASLRACLKIARTP